MKSKTHTYKGFKIHEVNDMFKVYTAEEWSYGKGFRCFEWEACSMKEAQDFINMNLTGQEVTCNNFSSHNEVTGFSLIK